MKSINPFEFIRQEKLPINNSNLQYLIRFLIIDKIINQKVNEILPVSFTEGFRGFQES